MPDRFTEPRRRIRHSETARQNPVVFIPLGRQRHMEGFIHTKHRTGLMDFVNQLVDILLCCAQGRATLRVCEPFERANTVIVGINLIDQTISDIGLDVQEHAPPFRVAGDQLVARMVLQAQREHIIRKCIRGIRHGYGVLQHLGGLIDGF